MLIDSYNGLILALDLLNLAFGIALLILIIRISRTFEGLPKIRRPWNILMFSMILFFIHYITVIISRFITFDYMRADLELIFSAAGTGFLILLLYGLYSLYNAWRPR